MVAQLTQKLSFQKFPQFKIPSEEIKDHRKYMRWIFEMRGWGLYSINENDYAEISASAVENDVTHLDDILMKLVKNDRETQTLEDGVRYVPLPIEGDNDYTLMRNLIIEDIINSKRPCRYMDVVETTGNEEGIWSKTSRKPAGVYLIDSLITDEDGTNMVVDVNLMTLLAPDVKMYQFGLKQMENEFEVSLEFVNPNLYVHKSNFPSPFQIYLPYKRADQLLVPGQNPSLIGFSIN